MKRSRRNGTVRKWFYSYTAVLLLPILFGILIYLFSVRLILDKEQRLQKQDAERDYAYLTQLEEGIVSNAQNIMLHDDVAYFSERRGSIGGEAIQVRKAQDLLKGFGIANKAIASLYVFYPQENLIITDTNCLTMEKNTLLSNTIRLWEEPFKSVLDSIPYGRFYILEQSGSSRLFYATATQGKQYFLEQEIVVMLEISQPYLANQFSEAASLVILAGEGENERVCFGNRDLEAELPNDDYFISERKLSSFGVTVQSIYSNEETKEEFQRIWIILIIYAGCCLLIGPCIVYWISRKNYTPVEDLIELMNSNGIAMEEQDEFQAIHGSLLELLKGMRDNRRRSRKIEAYYEESSLYYLLKTNRGRSVRERNWNEVFPYQNFVVVAFEAEDVKEVFQEQEAGEDMELLDFVIANVSSEFYVDFTKKLTGKLEGLYCLVLNIPDDTLAEQNYLILEKAKNVCRFLQERFGFSVCADISSVKESRSLLPDAYKELIEITEFRDCIGSEELVLCYDTFSDDAEIRREMNYFTDINRLSELLRKHRHKEAEELLSDIRRDYQTDEWEKKEEMEAQEALEIQAALESDNVRAEEEQAADLPGEEARSTREGKSAQQTIYKVEAYMKDHYLDPQLTVSSIAYLFELNPSYLSRSFCNVTGVGMLDYLTMLRLEHAKKCMEAGESVNNAAIHSGFYTCRPFIRAFKEEMGVTPGEYYKNRQKKERL